MFVRIPTAKRDASLTVPAKPGQLAAPDRFNPDTRLHIWVMNTESVMRDHRQRLRACEVMWAARTLSPLFT